MQSVSHGYSENILHGLSSAQQGLSFFTSIGLQNLQQDIYSLSGFLAASIPFITYAILKGGVSSFVHLASSMMGPAHSAASTAAIEQTSGNYSFGNTSFGQTSYNNTSAMQSNLAPSLSGGFFHENSGVSSAVYSADENILKQSNSDLRTSVFSDDSISKSLQTSKMYAKSTMDTAQNNYSENLSSYTRNLVDLTNHLANSENYSSNTSQREAYELQERGGYFQNVAESWGKQHGLSSRRSTELLIGLGVDFYGTTAKGNLGFTSNEEEALNSANNLIKSEEFQKNFQKLQDISSSESYANLDETGKRLVESTSESFDQMQSSQHSFQVAQSEYNQISENTTWAEQNSHLIHRSHNQDFINWASSKYANEGGFSKVEQMLSRGDATTQGELINDFITYARLNTGNVEISSTGNDRLTSKIELPTELSPAKEHSALQSHLSSSKDQFSNRINDKKKEFSNTFSRSEKLHEEQFNQVSSNIETSRKEAIDNFSHDQNRSLFLKPLKLAKLEGILHLNKLFEITEIPEEKIAIKDFLAKGFEIKEEPFWMKREEKS